MRNIASILIERGEGLLDDDGVDAAVAETITTEIMHSIATQARCVVVVTEGGYWGKGEDLESAVASAYKEGARGSQSCVIYAYVGGEEKLAEIGVTSLGDISYPMSCTSTRIGKVKLPMKQRGAK
jgi:hypothetical protein